MTCPTCAKPYKKYRSKSGRWLYERACTCKRAAAPRHQLNGKSQTPVAPRCQ